MIPRYAPTYTYADLLTALHLCLTGNPLIKLRGFLRRLYGTKHVYLFAGARVALYALLKAYNRPGGVLIPAYNCIAVPEAVIYSGYQPVFADIDIGSFNMNARYFGESLLSNITVVVLTHQFGIPCDVDAMLQVCRHYDVLVVEDAAAAIGARFRGTLVGTFGDATIISFHRTKVISGGIGGALLTNDDEIAGRVERLLDAAAASESWVLSFAGALAWKTVTSAWVYPVMYLGYKALHGEPMFQVVSPQTKMPPDFFRLFSSFSAALVLTQLDRLDSNLARRRKIAQIYLDELSDHPAVKLPVIPEDCSPAWIQFPVLVDDKRAFYKHMQRAGVDLSWTFRYSCADSFGLDGFPNARRAAQSILGLPTYPSLSDEKARYICAAAKEYSLA